VGIAGFSQGGYVASLVAAADPTLAFVAVGSAPGVSPREQNDFAIASDLRRRGFDEDVVARALELRRRVDLRRRSKAPDPSLDKAIEAAANEPWFRVSEIPRPPFAAYSPANLSVLDFDPLASWRRVHVPVLELWGELDPIVPAAKSKELIAGALRDAKARDVTLRILSASGHGLLLIGSKSVWDWPRLSPDFHATLVEWIRQHGLRACGQGAARQERAGSALRCIQARRRERRSRSTSCAAGSAARLCASAGSAARL
jgi:pimeloyl-ACP methyl ester carboxylesterase